MAFIQLPPPGTDDLNARLVFDCKPKATMLMEQSC